MKIQIISDLHQEFGVSDLSFKNADLVILAGDTNIGVKGVEWVKRNISNIPVIYVLGNHEYYKGAYPKTLVQISEAAKGTNITILENNTVEYNGIRFHGATLWTDFSLFGSPEYYGMLCQEKMNDYRKIRLSPSYSKLRSIDTYKIHKFSRLWLENSLENSGSFKNIVVTHHAPSIQSVPLQFQNDLLTSAYASNLEDIIIKYKPLYWIHGHIHTPCRYKIDQTEIICNPHGYIDEPYNGYDKELLIEL